MKNRTIGYVMLAIVFGLGFASGYMIADTRTENEMLTRANDVELQDHLDAMRFCMESAGRTGCRMSVENFRTYHAIKREIERRQTTGSIVSRREIEN